MLLGAIALIVFLLLRLVNLDLIPVFADEAIYIRWAQLIGSDWHNFFIPLSDGKTPLFMWLLAPLLKFGADPLLTGRLLSVAAGLGTVIGIYLLTKKLFDRQTAIWAAGLSVIQPFLVFYDRLSLVDSWLTALIVWSVYLSLNPSLWLGLFWAGALLTKPSAGLFIAISAIWPALKRKNWFTLAGAAVLAFAIFNLQRLSSAFHLIQSRSGDYLQSPHFSFDSLKLFIGWLAAYFSWIGLIVFALTLAWAVWRRQLKILALSLLVLVPFMTTLLIGKIVYPRYLLPLVPFMVIIIAWGLRQWRHLGLAAAAVLAILWMLPIKLPPAETVQYFESWSAGYGLKEIRNYLRTLPEGQKVMVATEGSFGTLPDGLSIYFFGDPKIEIKGVGFPKTTVNQDMETALTEGKRVFLVANWQRYTLTDVDRLKLIAEYPRPTGEKLMFYEVY
ncbi:MAG TPA: glycosyltransferase family 39 protein [Patescibacteria group bacterium]|nr:glycosyltransferase family 39 protein [Patescibacteria group bacterium]